MKKILIIAALLVLTILTPAFTQDARFDSELNLPFNEKCGNVDPQTGVVNVGTTDLVLPGRAGFDFSFGRQWKTNTSNAFTMYLNGDGSNRL